MRCWYNFGEEWQQSICANAVAAHSKSTTFLFGAGDGSFPHLWKSVYQKDGWKGQLHWQWQWIAWWMPSSYQKNHPGERIHGVDKAACDFVQRCLAVPYTTRPTSCIHCAIVSDWKMVAVIDLWSFGGVSKKDGCGVSDVQSSSGVGTQASRSKAMTCELWGTTITGWSTDFVILLTCVVCGVMDVSQRPGSNYQVLFLVLVITTGLSFGSGGIAHMLLFLVEESGNLCGSSMTEENSTWMYAWLLSVVVSPFSPAALVSLAAIHGKMGLAWALVMIVFLSAAAISVLEVAVFFSQLEVSGQLVGYWITVISLLTTVLFLLDGLTSGFSKTIVYGILAAVMNILGIASKLLLDGVLPGAFNANTLFHVFITLMVVFAFLSRPCAKSETTKTPSQKCAEVTSTV